MALDQLTLGERMVMAARLAAAEHLREDADAAGLDVVRIQRLLQSQQTRKETQIRQDLFVPLSELERDGDPKEAA